MNSLHNSSLFRNLPYIVDEQCLRSRENADSRDLEFPFQCKGKFFVSSSYVFESKGSENRNLSVSRKVSRTASAREKRLEGSGDSSQFQKKYKGKRYKSDLNPSLMPEFQSEVSNFVWLVSGMETVELEEALLSNISKFQRMSFFQNFFDEINRKRSSEIVYKMFSALYAVTDGSSTLKCAQISVEREAEFETKKRNGYQATNQTWALGKGRYTHVMNLLAASGQLSLVLNLFEAMETKSTKRDTYTFNTVLLAFCKAGKLREAENLLNKMSQKLRERTERESAWKMKTHWRNQARKSIVDTNGPSTRADENARAFVINKINTNEGSGKDSSSFSYDGIDFGLIPAADAVSYTTVLDVYAKSGEWRKAEKLANAMVEYGVEMTGLAMAKVIEACQTGGNWERCLIHLDKIEWSSEADVAGFCYNRALQALGNADRWNEARDLFLKMRNKQGIKPDVRSYNLYILATKMSGVDAEEAIEETFNWMLQDDVSPDTVTFNKIIALCRDAGSIGLAFHYHEKMSVMGLAPCVVTVLEMVRTFLAADMLERVLPFVEQSQKQGVMIDTRLYNTLMAAMVKAERWSVVSELWNRMLSEGCVPNQMSFNILLGMEAKRRGIGAAMDLFHSFRDFNSFAPQVDTFNTLISACAEHADMQAADWLLSLMKERGVEPNRVTYNSLIRVAHLSGHGSRAAQFWRDMKTGNVMPDGFTVSLYLTALESSGMFLEAMSVYSSVRGSPTWSGSFRLLWFTKLISCAVRAGDLPKAKEILGDCLDSGLEPGDQVYLALLSGCEAAGEWESAMEYLQRLRESSRKALKGGGEREPSVEAFNFVIGACERAGEAQRALEVFRGMQKCGVEPAMSTFAVVVRALQRAAMWEEAYEIYQCIPLERREGALPVDVEEQ